jgi:hypothetical protein
MDFSGLHNSAKASSLVRCAILICIFQIPVTSDLISFLKWPFNARRSAETIVADHGRKSTAPSIVSLGKRHE